MFAPRNGWRKVGTLKTGSIMMKRVFPKKSRSYPVAINIELKVIVDRCLDRRFRVAHRRFIKSDLGLTPENIVPIKRAGGAGPLRLGKKGWKKLPKDLREQLELFVKHHPEIRRIILINHEDCRRFDKLRKKGEHRLEKWHLERAVRLVAKKFPDKEVYGYFGGFVGKKGKIRFKLLARS